MILLGIIDLYEVLMNFFKKSETSCAVFFGIPYNILRGKKSKIVSLTARSIWAGVPYID